MTTTAITTSKNENPFEEMTILAAAPRTPPRSKKLFHIVSSNKFGISAIIAGFLCNFMVFGIGFSYGVFQEFYGSPSGPLALHSDAKIALIGTVSTSLTYIDRKSVV